MRLPSLRRALPAGRAAACTALFIAVACGLAARPPASVRLDAGGVSGPFLALGSSASERTDLHAGATALDPEAASPENRFRFRAFRPGAVIRLPLEAPAGGLRLTLKAMARVRTAVSVYAGGALAGRLIVPRGPWDRHRLELPDVRPQTEGFEAQLALQALPMVRVPEEYAARPELWVAEVELQSARGLRFTYAARAWLAAVPLAVFAFALAVGAGARAGLVASLAAAAGVIGLARLAPLPLLLAVPRLLPCALGAGLLARAALGRAPELAAAARAGVAGLVAAGILFHGSLAFVPGYDPGDLEIHVRRARDLGSVSLDYDSLLRYGSHLPTPSQTFGEATLALGSRTLFPYSPLPYVFYYALHALGMDLHWAMPVANTVLAMALAAWLFVAAGRLFCAGAAGVAALLYVLDLPVWHHIARSHAPAAFGMALAPAALLLLATEAGRLDSPRRAAVCGCALGAAVLAYSTLVVLVGLFGVALVALLAVDASGLSRQAKHGAVLALAVGGLLAGLLYYVHYLPGLFQGASPGVATPDPFLGRTFLIFHNESRQSMRVWAAGFLLPLCAGLAIAPLAFLRARAAARPVLTAWLAAWALTMLLKEPFLFPRPLRWAKEDQFVSPLLALLIGAAAWSLPKRWMRWTAAALAVAIALWLQLADFRDHAAGVWS